MDTEVENFFHNLEAFLGGFNNDLPLFPEYIEPFFAGLEGRHWYYKESPR
jgi:hypothetical protein